MTSEQLWNAALGELELNLSKANFTTWFKNTAIVLYEGHKVVIGVPNTFTKVWLEKKYHQAILKTLQQLTDRNIKEVHYQVEQSPFVRKTLGIPEPTPDITQKTVVLTPGASSHTATTSTRTGLNPRYTFETYVVGKGNELAHAAALAVAAKPGSAYNPLLIYGGVGLGKTHLLQSIGNRLIQAGKRVLYVTSETFANDFIHAVKSGEARKFQETYRNVDVLLIDDIQFISGKEGTQEAFFHTFNELQQSNKQIVISSDRPPSAIGALESRLRSRLHQGMIADISPLDFETRIAILNTKLQERQFPLPEEVVHYLGTIIQNNVREMEGALNKIIAMHQLKNIDLTLESIKRILAPLANAPARRSIVPRTIIETVAEFFDVKVEDLAGKSREKRLAHPRQIIMYLMREELKASFPAIGHELGGRDHTTAMHACSKIAEDIELDTKLKQDIQYIKERLYNQ